MVTLQTINPNFVHQHWPKVKGFIERAVDTMNVFPDWANSYTIENILQYVVSGQWLLLVAVEDEEIIGSATVSFINYPLHRVAFVTSIGGRMLGNKEVLQQFKTILSQHGATKIQANCRPSMLRLLSRVGFEPRNTLTEILI